MLCFEIMRLAPSIFHDLKIWIFDEINASLFRCFFILSIEIARVYLFQDPIDSVDNLVCLLTLNDLNDRYDLSQGESKIW